MKNKFGAFGARQFSLETLVGGQPGTTIFQNPGGGGGGGLGGSHTRTGPGHPPVPPNDRGVTLQYTQYWLDYCKFPQIKESKNQVHCNLWYVVPHTKSHIIKIQCTCTTLGPR